MSIASKLSRSVAGLKYGLDGSVYRIHFDRPDKFNAITIEMYDALGKAMHEANENADVKFTVFSGEGPYYSAGNDLMTFASLKTPDDVKRMAERGADILRDFVASFIDHRKPVIGLVHGPALGITVTTLALFDVVFASDKATFHTPFTSLGYSPEGCSSVLFPKIFGQSKANEMLLFGRKIDAQEALQWGLVSRVFSHDKFADETAALIKQYAKFPANTLTYNKTMVREFTREELHRVNNIECMKLCERWQSRECAEAMARFSSRKN